MNQKHKPKSKPNDESEENGESAIFGTIAKWGGAISAFILGVAAVATAVVGLAAKFPTVLPFLAPFDASISLRDIRQIAVNRTEDEVDGKKVPALDISLHYILEKSGPSTLTNCQMKLQLQDEFYGSRTQTLTDTLSADLSETFHVKADQYGKTAALLMTCYRRASNVVALTLPDVPGLSAPILNTYVLCIGERKDACGGTPNWASCSTNVTAWAKSNHPAECVSVDYKKLSDVSGNQCGYATFSITCSSK